MLEVINAQTLGGRQILPWCYTHDAPRHPQHTVNPRLAQSDREVTTDGPVEGRGSSREEGEGERAQWAIRFASCKKRPPPPKCQQLLQTAAARGHEGEGRGGGGNAILDVQRKRCAYFSAFSGLQGCRSLFNVRKGC